MKILFITFSTVPFGPNDLLYYKAAERMLAAGHEVLVSMEDWGAESSPRYLDLARQGARIILRPRPVEAGGWIERQWQRLLFRLGDPAGAYRFMSWEDLDLVVISDPGTYHMLGDGVFAPLLLELKIPFLTISQYHDEAAVLPPGRLEAAREFFGKAAEQVFVSQRNLERARHTLCMDLPKAHVLDNPPGLASLDPEPYPLDLEAPSWALVARLECAIKCQHLVLQALAEPRWKERAWTLTLYGKGPDEAYLRHLIQHLGLGARVSLAGHCANIREVWRRHHMLVLGSSGEGKPLAITEAMICGRPCVVTDVGGNAELVTEDVTGFVAEAPTVALIAAALERAWLQRHRWPEMGAAAREVMLARLQTPPEEALVQIIETLAGGAARRPAREVPL